MKNWLPVLLACLGLGVCVQLGAKELTVKHKIKYDKGRISVKNKYFSLQMIPRTPDQMEAFYYARGFPPNMLKEIREFCLITTGLKNLSQDIIWLEVADWQFSADGKPVKRFHRKTLLDRWKTMKIPLRFQSTFRWTLIPEKLDYRPDEREGGNIVLPRTGKPITVNAVFHLGKNKTAGTIKVKIDNVVCAKDNGQASKGKK